MDDFQVAESYLTKCIDLDLNGQDCAEARKVMGKIGLLHGGLSSKKNSLLDVKTERYFSQKTNSIKNIMDFINTNNIH